MSVTPRKYTITYQQMHFAFCSLPTEAQIESEITQAGAKLGQEWSERLKRAFVNYLEESEIKNQALTPPARRGRHSH